MELELKTSSSADALLERAERRGLTGDCSKISPHTVCRNLRPKSKDQYSRVLCEERQVRLVKVVTMVASKN
jgi:hypothetical protein